MHIELGEPAMIVAMLQHFFLPMKPKMGCALGWTADGWMDGISPHSTGLCPLLGPLPCYFLQNINIKEAGQWTR